MENSILAFVVHIATSVIYIFLKLSFTYKHSRSENILLWSYRYRENTTVCKQEKAEKSAIIDRPLDFHRVQVIHVSGHVSNDNKRPGKWHSLKRKRKGVYVCSIRKLRLLLSVILANSEGHSYT